MPSLSNHEAVTIIGGANTQSSESRKPNKENLMGKSYKDLEERLSPIFKESFKNDSKPRTKSIRWVEKNL